MEIRCPKCKYRFEEAIAPYEAEHSCACPRCGTPFVFTQATVSDVEEAQKPSDQRRDDIAESARIEPQESLADSPNAPNTTTTEDILALRERRLRRTINFHDDTNNPYLHRRNARTRRNKSCFRSLIIFTILFIIIVLYATNRCGGKPEKPPTYDESMMLNSSSAPSDSITSLFSDIENAPAETAPAWIQGTWTAEMKGYDLIVRISKNKITETAGAHTLRGTYVCKQQKLICRFGEEEIFVYTLDPTSQTIDCGNGIIMRKTQ